MKSPRSSPSRGLETTEAIEPGGPAMRAGQKGRPVAATDPDGHGDAAQDSAARQGLPEELRPLFWDCDFDALQLQQTPDFIVGRILASGSWDDVGWLRKTVGDATLRHSILESEGRLLSRKQLRFWELVLKLPTDRVSTWLANALRETWDDRACP